MYRSTPVDWNTVTGLTAHGLCVRSSTSGQVHLMYRSTPVDWNTVKGLTAHGLCVHSSELYFYCSSQVHLLYRSTPADWNTVTAQTADVTSETSVTPSCVQFADHCDSQSVFSVSTALICTSCHGQLGYLSTPVDWNTMSGWFFCLFGVFFFEWVLLIK